MANVNRTPTTGSLSLNGRGVTGGPIVTGEGHSKSGWGVGLAFTGQSLKAYDTTLDKSITPGLDALVFTGYAPTVNIDHYRDVGLGALTLTSYAPTLEYSWAALPDKASLTLTGKTPSAEIDHFRDVGTGGLTFTGNTPSGEEDYFRDAGTDALALTGIAPSAEIDHFRDVGVGSLTFTGAAPSLNLTIGATTGTLTFTGTLPAFGGVVKPTTGSLTFTTYQATFDDVSILVGTGSIAFTGDAIARINVANSGTSITNPNATTQVPSNYEQCDYTGFRQLPGSLKLTWNKHAVRKKSWEERHPQEVLRSAPERPKGSRRPERADTFIDTAVDSEDL